MSPLYSFISYLGVASWWSPTPQLAPRHTTQCCSDGEPLASYVKFNQPKIEQLRKHQQLDLFATRLSGRQRQAVPLLGSAVLSSRFVKMSIVASESLASAHRSTAAGPRGEYPEADVER